MFDVKKIEKEAQEEVAKEQAAKAKDQIKAKLKQIAASRAVTANLEREYAALLLEVGEG